MTYRTRRFAARLDNVEAVKAFVLDGVGALAPRMILLQIDMIVEELFVNIASYAYPDGIGDAVVGYCVAGDVLHMRFEDSGLPFDPTARPDAAAPASIEETHIGGLGIQMVRMNTSSFCYCRKDGLNILTLSKSLTDARVHATNRPEG